MPSSRTLQLLTVAAMAATATGCAKRLPLTPKELDRVKTEAGVQPLRVYTSKHVIARYRDANTAQQYTVEKKIQETSSGADNEEFTRRDDSGLILKIDELNGDPALWVTFDARFSKPEDAMIFVQSGDGIFRLNHVPEREGFRPPEVFRQRTCKKCKMKNGRMKSLAEANDVLLIKKKSGKLLTIDLQVKKVVSDRVKTKRRRAGGID
ncbi:MAG: hypothetical protein IPK74_34090 [Deltaproteobacteria bacterium]|nr:hypothetical protein [Deltaproteobacteria bacterium]